MEWIKNNIISMVIMGGSLIGVYVALMISVTTLQSDVRLYSSEIITLKAKVDQISTNVTENKIVNERQSVLLDGVSKLVQRNIDRMDSAERQIYGLSPKKE